jgi:hypothetical protein
MGMNKRKDKRDAGKKTLRLTNELAESIKTRLI